MHTWKPTRKWVAALAGGVLTILAHYAVSGEFGGTERGELLILAAALAPAYLRRNEDTPGGVPLEPLGRDIDRDTEARDLHDGGLT